MTCVKEKEPPKKTISLCNLPWHERRLRKSKLKTSVHIDFISLESGNYLPSSLKWVFKYVLQGSLSNEKKFWASKVTDLEKICCVPRNNSVLKLFPDKGTFHRSLFLACLCTIITCHSCKLLTEKSCWFYFYFSLYLWMSKEVYSN